MNDKDKLIAKARKVVNELVARGWGLDEGASVSYCPVCKYELDGEYNYCPQCGWKIPTSYNEGVLDDVVAALAKGDEE